MQIQFLSQKKESRTDCLMPLHKPGNTHARKGGGGGGGGGWMMTGEKKRVVHSADENVAPWFTCARRQNVKQSDGGSAASPEVMQSGI